MSTGTLYLVPCPIDDGDPEKVLPAANFEVMRELDYFIVENVRSARRFLSRAGVGTAENVKKFDTIVKKFDTFEFVELNEHTRPEEVEKMLLPLLNDGRSAGVISEAGVPAVADPGADIVAAAHRKGLKVIPLVGPSSILLALMASGMNGQSFAFNGYFPVKPDQRAKAIKHFERRAVSEHQSQIFIETPYRNSKLFSELLTTCSPSIRLTVAADLTAPDEFIRTATIADWRKTSPPDLQKRPAIFILG